MSDDDPVDLEEQRRLDQAAHDRLTDKQKADLEELPVLLTDLTNEQLIDKGLDAKRRLDRARAGVMEMDELTDDEEVVDILVAEYLWRRIVTTVADEMERRRTGKAPRAKLMN
jgi:phage terminase Nu1 subunit (DNA packaging protein)